MSTLCTGHALHQEAIEVLVGQGAHLEDCSVSSAMEVEEEEVVVPLNITIRKHATTAETCAIS